MSCVQDNFVIFPTSVRLWEFLHECVWFFKSLSVCVCMYSECSRRHDNASHCNFLLCITNQPQMHFVFPASSKEEGFEALTRQSWVKQHSQKRLWNWILLVEEHTQKKASSSDADASWHTQNIDFKHLEDFFLRYLDRRVWASIDTLG